MENRSLSEVNSAEIAKKVAFQHEAMLKQSAQEASQLFPTPVEVSEQERNHGFSKLLEGRLLEVKIIDQSTNPSAKNRKIHFLEERLEELGSEKLKELGFSSGTTRVIREGDSLDLSILDKLGWIQAIR